MFVHNFSIEQLLEATVVLRRSVAPVPAATWQLFQQAAASASSMPNGSSTLLYVTGHPVGGAFALNLICISLKYLHTFPLEAPIAG